MNRTVKIYANGAINFGGKPTGFFVSQQRDKTRVSSGISLSTGEQVELELQHRRYSLASNTPACKNGRAQFDNDFALAFINNFYLES